MVRIGIAALVGAIVIFVWSALSWTFVGWHDTSGGVFPDESAVVGALRESVPATSPPGVYWIPGIRREDMVDEDATADWVERHEAGPIGLLVYQPEGGAPMPPGQFVRGFVIDLVSALIAACLLSLTAIGSYAGRVGFVVALGLLVGVYGDLIMWNYMYFPTDWTLVNLADDAVTWLLAGVPMAAIVKGRATRAG